MANLASTRFDKVQSLMWNVDGQSGSSLIQVMVGVAILAVLVAGMASFIDNSARQTQILQQKFDIIQSQQELMRDLSDAGLCACNFDPAKNTANASVLRFDSTNPTAAIELPQLFGSCVAGVPGNPFVVAGAPMQGTQSGLVVDKIRLLNLVDVGTGRFRGKLEVSFTADSLKMGRKPATVGMTMQVDASVPNQAKITNCSAGAEGLGGGGLGAGTVCPAETIVRSSVVGTNTYILPEGPAGVHAFLGGGMGYGVQNLNRLTMATPPCDQSFFKCDYSYTAPFALGWQGVFSVSCSGGGG